jgi:hypothetical protein
VTPLQVSTRPHSQVFHARSLALHASSWLAWRSAPPLFPLAWPFLLVHFTTGIFPWCLWTKHPLWLSTAPSASHPLHPSLLAFSTLFGSALWGQKLLLTFPPSSCEVASGWQLRASNSSKFL